MVVKLFAVENIPQKSTILRRKERNFSELITMEPLHNAESTFCAKFYPDDIHALIHSTYYFYKNVRILYPVNSPH